MVVYIDLLTGNNLKKSLGVYKVKKRYHNKNKRGGNFGIDVWVTDAPFNTPGYKAFQFSGEHNLAGEIYNLRFGEGWSLGSLIIGKHNYREIKYSDLIEIVRNYMRGN